MQQPDTAFLTKLMGKVKILAYHRVTDLHARPLAVSCATFRSHLQCLSSRRCASVTLRGLYADYIQPRRLPKGKLAVVTFDDGYRDNKINAWPMLQEFGFQATLFATVGYVGRETLFPWDQEKIADPQAQDYCMGWEELAQLDGQGMEIASHTMTHAFLSHIEPGQALSEMVQAKEVLTGRLGKPVLSVCYPAGQQNAAVLDLANQAGYKVGVVTQPRNAPRVPVTNLSLPRVGLYYRDSGLRFRLKMSGLFDVYRRLRK